MSQSTGLLYVVATPIGNLGDMSERAIRALQESDLVAAEDTRHTGKLLKLLGIDTPMVAYHDHNERSRADDIVGRLKGGAKVSLVSDAGTPLISDPGHHLIQLARSESVTVQPVPGPSAVVAALSASGIPCDRFIFEGFLPARQKARCEQLAALLTEPRTTVFYESPHRIHETLDDCLQVLGSERKIVLARELTKLHESWYCGSIGEVCQLTREKALKGEMVLIISGQADQPVDDDADLRELLSVLVDELPLKQAVAIAQRVTDHSRNRIYQLALELNGS